MSNIKCLACGGTKFSTRTVLMSTVGLTFIGLDWMNPNATSYTCEKCGYIMLYAQVAPKQEEERNNDPVALKEERKRATKWFENRT